MITEQHLPAMQGLIPACVTTCSAAGEPNTTVISQVWYVDEDHVALSHQFFNKTRRNIAENPHAVVMILSPENGATFDLSITYARTETEGPLFDEMASLQICAFRRACECRCTWPNQNKNDGGPVNRYV